MSKKTTSAAKPQAAVGSAGQQLFRKALSRSEDWSKDDLLKVLFWLRFVLSMALGLVWGVLPLLGATGHVSYLLLTSAIVYVYVHRYLGLNDQDFDGPMGLLGEGFMPSYGIFMLCWISVFNLLHADSGLLYSADSAST